MYKIGVYIPEDSLEKVKKAMFDAGAGKFKNYDCACWQTKGQGQFRPLEGANPHIGSHGKIEKVEEFRVEMICQDGLLKSAIAALHEAHPYEEPAFDVVRLIDKI